MSRPSMRSTPNQSMNSGGVGLPSPASMSRQAAISRSARRFRPRTTASMRWRVGVSSVSASSTRRCGQALGQRPHRPQQGVQRLAQRLAALQQSRAWGAVQSASSPWGLSMLLARARTSSAHLDQEALQRAAGRAFADAPLPAFAGQDAGRFQDRLQGLACRLIARDQIVDPALQPAQPSGLGADQPAAQFGGLQPRQMAGKGAVGGVEQMMALVEDVARGQVVIAFARARGLDHGQRVIGDDDAGAPRPAHAALDEAFAVVIAGRIDAFAAPVGETQAAVAPDQIDQPAGKIAAGDVAVARGARPARHQAERHRIARRAPAGRAPPPRNSAGRDSSRGPCG